MLRLRTLLTFCSLLSCLPVLAQTQEQGITDKNYREQYASYMLQNAYQEYGYLGASVTVSNQAGKTSYTVEPGPVYRIGSLTVRGLEDPTRHVVMQGAPEVGEVYSVAKLNDWLTQVRKRIESGGLPLRWQRDEMRIDREHAQVIVSVEFVSTSEHPRP